MPKPISDPYNQAYDFFLSLLGYGPKEEEVVVKIEKLTSDPSKFWRTRPRPTPILTARKVEGNYSGSQRITIEAAVKAGILNPREGHSQGHRGSSLELLNKMFKYDNQGNIVPR